MNLAEQLRDIDRRVGNYSYPLFEHIVDTGATDISKKALGRLSLRLALRIANLYDRHAETGEAEFYHAAKRHETELYRLMGENVAGDLELIKSEIITFFDDERRIWSNIQNGMKVSDREITAFMQRRSTDAFYYGRILKEFTKKDLSLALFVNMQLLDYQEDIHDYEDDVEHGAPNMVIMFLSQNLASSIPLFRQDALRMLRETQTDQMILGAAGRIHQQAAEIDFSGGYDFLKAAINEKYDTLSTTLSF